LQCSHVQETALGDKKVSYLRASPTEPEAIFGVLKLFSLSNSGPIS
jgi:hypothetical protein